MNNRFFYRRDFLRQAGTLGSIAMMAGLPQGSAALSSPSGTVIEDAVQAAEPSENPKYHIKFAVCGMSHDHIYGMVGAIQRGGGVLVAAYGAEPDKVATFKKRYPDVKMVASEKEILEDSSIQLVLSSKIPNERAALGVQVMK